MQYRHELIGVHVGSVIVHVESMRLFRYQHIKVLPNTRPQPKWVSRFGGI